MSDFTTLKLNILGVPQSKQSARFRGIKMGNRIAIQSYQKKEVMENERNIAFDVKHQLPSGWIPFDVPVGVRVKFVFPPLKTWPKKKLASMISGTVLYKETKPDLTDNLMKGLWDAMNGIVFTDDARICKVESEKIFGIVPRTEVELYIIQ